MHPLEKIVSFVIALVYTNLRVFTYCRRIQIIGFCGNSVCFHSFTLFCKPYKMRCFGNLLLGQFPGKKSITKVNVGLYYRRSNRSCFVKKLFLKFSQNSQKFHKIQKHLCRSLFLVKPQAVYWKRDSEGDSFQSTFLWNTSGDCSCYYIRGC